MTSVASEPLRRAVLALGGNLGDRLALLQQGVDGLAALPATTVRAVSPVYETDPVGGIAQPQYLNAVVTAETSLSPLALLTRCLRLEAAAGRVRQEKWGPRTLDIDLIAVSDAQVDDLVLSLPHPGAVTRAFVLVPWLDVEPEAVLPGAGPVAALVQRLPAGDRAGVRRRDDLRLRPP